MSRRVKDIKEVLEFLKAQGICWVTMSRIENNLWDKGVAFYDSNYQRVAYYNEPNNILLI